MDQETERDAPTLVIPQQGPGPDTDPDPDAPFGREPGGEARAPYGWTRAGRPRLQAGGKRSPRAPAGPGKTSAPAKTPAGPDYRPAIVGLFQMVATPLAFTGEAGRLDAWATMAHGPGIAEGLNELAKIRPEVAAVLDRIIAIGPYGMVLGPLLAWLAQLAVNHSAIPEEIGKMIGARPRAELLAELDKATAAAAAAAA